MANLEALSNRSSMSTKGHSTKAPHHTTPTAECSRYWECLFKSTATLANGAMDMEDLESAISKVESAVVVVTYGTTGLGKSRPTCRNSRTSKKL